MKFTFLSHTFVRIHFYAIYCKYSSINCTEGSAENECCMFYMYIFCYFILCLYTVLNVSVLVMLSAQ